MKKFLIVVDMQNDFVDGALGSKEAVGIVDNVVEKINSFDGEIIATLDTHQENYLDTQEGKKLPVPHCIEGTDGWRINEKVLSALASRHFTSVLKPSFGSTELANVIKSLANGEDFSVELIGLCTDICVVSNALLLKAAFPEIEISVDAKCCAGVSVESHNASLLTMKCCQINVND